MSWYCVSIPHTCVFHAVNATFLNMLKRAEHNARECRVYRTVPDDGDGFIYYFSPNAAEHYRTFLEFWGSTDINEPGNLEQMRRIL